MNRFNRVRLPSSFILPPSSLFKVTSLEGPVEGRQHLAPGVRDHHVVLDPHAALARDIDPRLDRHDHARPKLFLAARLAHAGQLVDLPPDAVTEAVTELVLEAGVVDHVTGDAV